MATSNLVHLFKFSFLLLFWGFRVHAVGPEATFDQAIFRLSGQVFFLSDLKNNQAALRKLSCLKNDSFISKFLKVDLKEISSLDLSKTDSSSDPDSDEGSLLLKKSDIYPYIYLEKLKNSALGRGKEQLSQAELQGLNKSCRKLSWKRLKIEEKALFLVEAYLRDRFSRSDNLELAFKEFQKGLEVKESHEIFNLRPSKLLKDEMIKNSGPNSSKDSPKENEGAKDEKQSD